MKVYLGVDPSSNQIHLGHSILLKKLREFQDLGHEVILLVGDFTGMIGDPSGKDKARLPLTHAQVLKNSQTYQQQAAKIVLFSGKNSAKILYNSKWLAKLTLKQIIELGSKFTVQQMLERDMFQERIKAGRPISLHEFIYPLLQGYDSLAMNVDVELGGSDQTFNMLVGRQLRKGQKFVITTPLLPGLDGQKMSKSAGNTIPLTSTANEMFGRLMSLKDELLVGYFALLTERERRELDEMKTSLKEPSINPMTLKLKLAKEIVGEYHGTKVAEEAETEFKKVVQGKGLPTNIPEITLERPLEAPTALEIVRLCRLASSNQSASRLIEQGGVEIDRSLRRAPKEKVKIQGETTLLRVGKRGFLKINWSQK